MLLNSERHHDKASFLLVCGLKLALTFNDKITLICTPISLDEEMLSTREGRTNDKPLMGEVWEVRYER
jgi:hypothetical protein